VSRSPLQLVILLISSLLGRRQHEATKYNGAAKRGGPGRPSAGGDKVQQLLTVARENPWDYTRLRDALSKPGYLPR
jgi:hypothetical protein